MLEWIYYLNPENPPANHVHERDQSTLHLPKLLVWNVLGKETLALLSSSVVHSIGQGWWQEILLEEQRFQKPEIKEVITLNHPKESGPNYCDKW